MQYVDYENIAVSVLRTTPEKIDPKTLQPLLSRGNDNVTHTVTYFLNTITMQLREGVSWTTEVPQAVQTQGQLCPEQRRMPQFGSVLTETLVAVVLFVKMPFNVILYGVYIFDQWKKNDETGRCPMITRGHSALLTGCEANALTLKPFFNSVERIGQLIFRTLSYVGRLFGKGPLQTFINGVKIFAENTDNPVSTQIVGAKMLRGVSNVPMTKYMQDLANSALRMPSYMRMFVATASTMVWAEFLYEFTINFIHRTVRASFTGNKSPEGVFYSTMYDFAQDFDKLVTSSMYKSCTGLSLMFGYTNPWANIVRNQCDSWASIPNGILTFLNVFLVDIPTAKCICKDSQGSNFARYATDKCFANAPDQIKPTIRAMIDIAQNQQENLKVTAACDLIIKYTTTRMEQSMQPFFDKQYKSAENMGSALDYLLRIGTQKNAAEDLCTNYQTNPFVVAIIPEPVDYFRICGKTSLCRSRYFPPKFHSAKKSPN